MSSNQKFSIVPRIANGAIAATVAAALCFPLDLVKIRLQNQFVGPNGERQYSSMYDCFMKTLKNEGRRGLYRGLTVNLSTVGFEKGLKLSVNDYFRYLLSSDKKRLSLFRQAVAGGGAGAIQMMLSCPMEMIKIQLQDAGRVATEAIKAGLPVRKLTAFGLVKDLLKEKGISAMYRGLVPTGGRDIAFGMIYFPLYAYIYEKGPRAADGEPKLYWNLICGASDGAFGAWITTPFDVIKTRMQAIAKSPGQRQYTGTIDCITHTLRTEGFTALFKGGICRIMYFGPLLAITQTVYYVGVAEKLLGVETQKFVK